MTNDEKRSEQRIRSRGTVTVRAEGGTPVPAVIYDVSPSGLGLGLESEVGLTAGTAVDIDGSGFAAHGVVRFCFSMNQTFRIGIQLKPLEPA